MENAGNLGVRIWARAQVLLGVLLGLVGALGVPLSILAALDPIGTQMANDADPLGVPPTPESSLMLAGAYAAMLFIGATLFRRGKRYA